MQIPVSLFISNIMVLLFRIDMVRFNTIPFAKQLLLLKDCVNACEYIVCRGLKHLCMKIHYVMLIIVSVTQVSCKWMIMNLINNVYALHNTQGDDEYLHLTSKDRWFPTWLLAARYLLKCNFLTQIWFRKHTAFRERRCRVLHRIITPILYVGK